MAPAGEAGIAQIFLLALVVLGFQILDRGIGLVVHWSLPPCDATSMESRANPYIREIHNLPPASGQGDGALRKRWYRGQSDNDVPTASS